MNIIHPIIIRPRRGTLNEWNEKGKDIILRKSEIAVIQNNYIEDKSEPQFKIGDGITPFKDLPYVTMHEAFVNGIIYTTGGIYTTIGIDYMHRNNNFNTYAVNNGGDTII